MANMNKLKGLIVEHGYTQSSFSNQLKISKTSMVNKLKGRSKFTVDQISKCKALLFMSNDTLAEIFLP